MDLEKEEADRINRRLQEHKKRMAEVFLKIKDQVIEIYKNNQWEEQINENA